MTDLFKRAFDTFRLWPDLHPLDNLCEKARAANMSSRRWSLNGDGKSAHSIYR